MNSISVTARQWEYGWELWIGDEVATQVSTLDKAATQIRDYLDTIEPATDHSDWDVTITPDLGGLEEQVSEARAFTAAATRAQEDAAKRSREAVRALRQYGLSVTDTAAILGVSRGRISQLDKAA